MKKWKSKEKKRKEGKKEEKTEKPQADTAKEKTNSSVEEADQNYCSIIYGALPPEIKKLQA